MKNIPTCQSQFCSEDAGRWIYNNPLDLKEEIVCEFVKVITDMEHESCDETENRLQKIIYKTRGLIHKELNRPEIRKHHP